jgi:hypothetical protein
LRLLRIFAANFPISSSLDSSEQQQDKVAAKRRKMRKKERRTDAGSQDPLFFQETILRLLRIFAANFPISSSLDSSEQQQDKVAAKRRKMRKKERQTDAGVRIHSFFKKRFCAFCASLRPIFL